MWEGLQSRPKVNLHVFWAHAKKIPWGSSSQICQEFTKKNCGATAAAALLAQRFFILRSCLALILHTYLCVWIYRGGVKEFLWYWNTFFSFLAQNKKAPVTRLIAIIISKNVLERKVLKLLFNMLAILEPVIRMSPEDITVISKFSQIKYIYVLPIWPIFWNLCWPKSNLGQIWNESYVFRTHSYNWL